MINDELIAQIKSHAEQAAPLECCGLLLALHDAVGYWPCRNLSNSPNRFELHPNDYSEASDTGTIIAVVHSHVGQSADASEADRVGCEHSGLPWVIYSLTENTVNIIKPVGLKYGLLQRPYIYGVYDCATLVVDYYRQNLGIALPNHKRYEACFWEKGLCLSDKYRELGFIDVPHTEAILPHDVLLIQIRSQTANHSAIYLGDGRIMHHLEKRLSERVLYSEFWQKQTLYIMRYQHANHH